MTTRTSAKIAIIALVLFVAMVFLLPFRAHAVTGWDIRTSSLEAADSARTRLFTFDASSMDSASTDKWVPATDTEGGGAGDSLNWFNSVSVNETQRHTLYVYFYYPSGDVATEQFEFIPYSTPTMIADSTWDATREATLKKLSVINSGGDAVVFQSTGSNGRGMYIYGHGTGPGIYGRGGGSAGSAGILALSTSGFGFRAASTGAQPAFQADNVGAGHAVVFDATEGGQGMVIASDSSDALQIYGGVASTENASPHAIEINFKIPPGSEVRGDDAIRIKAYAPGAKGIWVSSDSGDAALYDGGAVDNKYAAIRYNADSTLIFESTTMDASFIDSIYAALDSIQLYLDAAMSSRSTLTTSDNIGINWADISNQGTSVDLSTTTIFATDIATAVVGIATNGITAASIETDAIGADELATSAVDEIHEYDTSLVTTATGIGAMQKDIAANTQYTADNAADYKATGFSSHTAGDVWTSGTRTLSTVGVIAIVDSLWQADTTSRNSIVGSYGEILYKTAFVQGAASGLTAAEIVDSIWQADTLSHNSITGSYGEILYKTAFVQGAAAGLSATEILDSLNLRDSSLYAEGYWKKIANRSDSGATAAVPDSTLGDISYIANTQGDYKATGYSTHSAADVWTSGTRTLTASLWSTAQRDSVLNTILDANKGNYKATGYATHTAADVYNTFISGSNEDAFKADVSALSTFDATTDSTLLANVAEVAAENADSIGSITASVDTSSIADAVWNRAKSGHTTSGTFGYNLDVPVSSIAGLSGSGAYTYNIVVVDSGATVDSVIPTAIVFVNNHAQNMTPYQANTSNTGLSSFNLDAGNWVMFTTEPGFAVNLDSFTVSGTATDTLFVYTDPGSKTTIAWDLTKATATKYAGAKVYINMVSENDSLLSVGDTLMGAAATFDIVLTASALGQVSAGLYPNSTFANDSTWYQAIIRDSGGRMIVKKLNFRVPDTSVVMRYQDLTRWK